MQAIDIRPTMNGLMSEPSREEGTSALGLLLRLVVVFGVVGGLISVFIVLATAHRDGRNAIAAYVEAIREGADAGEPSVVAGESAEVTRAIRTSESFSVSNFQGQSDTSCFWITLEGSGRKVDARAVVANGTVTAFSLSRPCDCPDDASKPCRLQ